MDRRKLLNETIRLNLFFDREADLENKAVRDMADLFFRRSLKKEICKILSDSNKEILDFNTLKKHDRNKTLATGSIRLMSSEAFEQMRRKIIERTEEKAANVYESKLKELKDKISSLEKENQELKNDNKLLVNRTEETYVKLEEEITRNKVLKGIILKKDRFIKSLKEGNVSLILEKNRLKERLKMAEKTRESFLKLPFCTCIEDAEVNKLSKIVDEQNIIIEDTSKELKESESKRNHLAKCLVELQDLFDSKTQENLDIRRENNELKKEVDAMKKVVSLTDIVRTSSLLKKLQNFTGTIETFSKELSQSGEEVSEELSKMFS